MLTPHAGAAPRVLLLVLVLVLMIPDTQAALAGLRTLLAVLPLHIQAVMAIRAVTLPQGTLAVLETIPLVPLVTTQNQATEGYKRRVAHTWCSTVVTCACLSHPSVAHSRLCNTQQTSHLRHPTLDPLCQMRGFLVSWLQSTAATTPSHPIPLYLTYLLPFDPVLHLSLFRPTSKVSYHPSYVPLLLLPPHTIYSSHPNTWLSASLSLVPCGLVLALCWIHVHRMHSTLLSSL